jgi:uncharacterized membrane protein (DUF106 family)
MNVNIFIIELILIAVAYVSFSVFVQRKLANYKRIKEIKKEMDSKMKELRAIGSNVEKEVLATKQKEITALASESMRHQIKPTLIILPIFFALFYVALPMAFPSAPKVTVLSYTVPYTTFFIAVSFVLGLLSTIVLGAYERVTAKRQQQASASPAQ